MGERFFLKKCSRDKNYFKMSKLSLRLDLPSDYFDMLEGF